MKNLAKHIVVVWFAFLLLLGNTPMEFIHLFAHHKDTTEHESKGLVFEKKHHHCSFLSLTLTSFENDYQVPHITCTIPSVYHVFNEVAAVSYLQRALVAVAPRGPPAV